LRRGLFDLPPLSRGALRRRQGGSPHAGAEMKKEAPRKGPLADRLRRAYWPLPDGVPLLPPDGLPEPRAGLDEPPEEPGLERWLPPLPPWESIERWLPPDAPVVERCSEPVVERCSLPLDERVVDEPRTLTSGLERWRTVVRLDSPVTAMPGRRLWMIVRLSGSDATMRPRFFLITNFFFGFFLMTVRLDGSSPETTTLRERRWTTTSLRSPPRTPNRVSVRPRVVVRLPWDSPRTVVWLPPPDCPMLWPRSEPPPDCPMLWPRSEARPLSWPEERPLSWPAAGPLLAPLPDCEPELCCAEDGAAKASAATVARESASVLICASEGMIPLPARQCTQVPIGFQPLGLFRNMNKCLFRAAKRPQRGAFSPNHSVDQSQRRM
jgi:hypothetical protein